VVPIPDEQNLHQIYQEQYYGDEKPGYLQEHEEDIEWWNLVHEERYERFENLLGGIKGRLLDVGSGPGSFLLHGQQRGWQTLGIEPASQAAFYSRAKGVEVVNEFLSETITGTLGKFEAIHMSEVLEHVPNPQNFLTQIGRLLAPGGVLCVTVPNDYNLLQLAVQRNAACESWWVAPPHHLNYFNAQSLTRLMNQCGLTVVSQQATFPMEFFLLMGEAYIGNNALGRQCHKKRMQFELSLNRAGLQNEKTQMFQYFADQGLGRELVFFAKSDSSTPEPGVEVGL